MGTVSGFSWSKASRQSHVTEHSHHSWWIDLDIFSKTNHRGHCKNTTSFIETRSPKLEKTGQFYFGDSPNFGKQRVVGGCERLIRLKRWNKPHMRALQLAPIRSSGGFSDVFSFSPTSDKLVSEIHGTYFWTGHFYFWFGRPCSKMKTPFSFFLHHVDVAFFLFMRYMATVSQFHSHPGCVLNFTTFLFWKCLHFRLVQSLSIQNSILNDPNKSKPKQRAEPFNFAMPSEHGLKEHSAGFSGEGELGLWGTVLGRRFIGLLVVSPWSASWDRPFVPIWLP